MRVRIGAGLLSVWSVLNLLVAAAVTALTLAGRPAPALQLVLRDDQLQAVDARVLAVVKAQALFANPAIVVCCALVLVLLRKGVLGELPWAWRALAFTLLPLQAFGFISDGALGSVNLAANVISSVVLVVGLALCSPPARLV
jgi:hypothetical protein